MSMAALDGMVMEYITDRLLKPERLVQILEAYLANSAEADVARRERLAQTRRRFTETEGSVDRLLQMVERGLIEVDDPSLRDRLTAAKQARQTAGDEVKLIEASMISGPKQITQAKIERFAQMVRDALSGPDPTFRKAYLRLFLESVTVGEGQIRMRGPTAALAKAATLDELPAASAVVPSSVREWRPVGDSNPCYRRERGNFPYFCERW